MRTGKLAEITKVAVYRQSSTYRHLAPRRPYRHVSPPALLPDKAYQFGNHRATGLTRHRGQVRDHGVGVRFPANQPIMRIGPRQQIGHGALLMLTPEGERNASRPHEEEGHHPPRLKQFLVWVAYPHRSSVVASD